MAPPGCYLLTHIQSVFLSSCTELKAAGRLAEAGSSLLRAQVWLGLPAFAIFAIIAPDVFALVFGEAWRSAGTYAQLLMPSIFLSFIALPLNALPIAFEKQQGELLFQSGMALARCVGLLIGGAFDSIQLAIALLSAATGAGWLLYLFWTMSLAGHRPGEVLRALVRECTLSIPCILPVGLAKIVMNANSPGWLMAVAAFCLVLSFGVVALRAMPMTALANSR